VRMEKVLVDTNVISYLMKGHSIADAYLKHLKNKTTCVAFVTIGELYLWAELRNWGDKKRELLEQRLRNFVVLPYDKTVAQKYAKLFACLCKDGRSIDKPDAWIAATALAFELPLVTHNGKHFINVPSLKVITETQEGGTSEKPRADPRP